jgi:hypothetical protein
MTSPHIRFRQLVLTLASSAFLVGATACGNDSSGKPSDPPTQKPSEGSGSAAATPPAPPPPPPAQSGPAWPRYTSAVGGYSVEMPGAPKESSEPVETVAGTITMHSATAEAADGMYIVNVSDYPTVISDVKRSFDGSRDQMLAQSPGTSVLEEREISLGAIPGRALVVDVPAQKATVRAHLYVAGKRVYQLMALGPAGADAAGAEKFFASFQLAP